MDRKNNHTLHRFQDEAMATHFELLVAHEDKTFAESLSHLCFRELERIEDLLSRFRDGSDIVRINNLNASETILISEECHTCIRQALEIQLATDGHFDIAVAGFMDLIRTNKQALEGTESSWLETKENKAKGKVTIHHDKAAVTCVEPGLKLDLGGIGKGFAVQHLAQLVEEMGGENYMISAGGSTVFAKGKSMNDEPWSVNFHSDVGDFSAILENESISASGFSVQGAHIVHNEQPLQLDEMTARRIWVKAEHSALSDALSTACLLMPDEQIIALSETLNSDLSIWKENDTGISQII